MMRRLSLFLLAFAMLFCVGCGETPPPSPNPTPQPNEPTTPPSSESEIPNMESTYSILFIGNSATYYNNMPNDIFEKFVVTSGYQVEVDAITQGGWTLAQFANPTDAFGAKVEEALTGEKKYDYVILQGNGSLLATGDPAQFYRAVRNLSQRIRATGARPVLYATWGHKTGSPSFSTNGLTNESMTWKLAAAYQAIGDELDIPVAYVGLAFYDIYTTRDDINLYDPDKAHPSYEGSYLAAATLFAKIFVVDPVDLSFTGTVPPRIAPVLLEAAGKAVFEPFEIPDQYKTSSEGIE